MNTPRILAAGCLTFAAAALSGCGGGQTVNALPTYPLAPLSAGQAEGMKIYAGPDGTIEKFSMYVTADAIPQWAVELADKEIGAGEVESFEIEQYADGRQTFEITRKIDGVKVEISVSTDKKVNYIERAMTLEQLPAPVQAAVKGIEGLTVEEIESRKGEGMETYEVEGKIGSMTHGFLYSADGKPLERTRQIPGKLKVRY